MLRQNRSFSAVLAILFMTAIGCTDPSSVDSKAPASAKNETPQKEASSKKDQPATPPSETPNSESTEAEPVKLTVGAAAPKIKLAKWIQGEPVEEFQAGHTYVVEFWATWCGPCKVGMPHIAKLQDKLRENVTFIGVTAEDEKTVTDFLAQTQDEETGKIWSEVATYPLALDDDRATNNAYMKAAGQGGIPTAFIVGPDAHIEWIGHPARIDEPLEQIVAGDWDRDAYLASFLEKERKAAEMRKTMTSLQQALKNKEWDKSISLLDGLIEQNPGQFSMILHKISILLSAEKHEDANAFAGQLAEKHWESPGQLNAIAWVLSSKPHGSTPLLETALRLSKQANELHQDQDAASLDTLARVHHQLGNLDEAIANQKKAIALNKELRGIEDRLQKYLEERNEKYLGERNGGDTKGDTEGDTEAEKAAASAEASE